MIRSFASALLALLILSCSNEPSTGTLEFRIIDQDLQDSGPHALLAAPQLNASYCYAIHLTGENIPEPAGADRDIFTVGGGNNEPDEGEHCTIEQGQISGSYRYGDTAQIKVPENSNLTIQLIGVPLSELNANGIANCSGAFEWKPVVDFDREDNLVFLAGQYLPAYKYTFYLLAEARDVRVNKGEQTNVVLNKTPSLHEHPCFSEIRELYTAASGGTVDRTWVNGYDHTNSYRFARVNATKGIYLDYVFSNGYANKALCDGFDTSTGNDFACTGTINMNVNDNSHGALSLGILNTYNAFFLAETLNSNDNSVADANNADIWKNSGTAPGGWQSSIYTTNPSSSGTFFPTWSVQASGQYFAATDGKGLKWAGGQADNCTSKEDGTSFSCGVIYKSWDNGQSWYRVFEGYKNSKITDGKKHAERGTMFFAEAFTLTTGATSDRIRFLYSRD